MRALSSKIEQFTTIDERYGRVILCRLEQCIGWGIIVAIVIDFNSGGGVL